VCAGLGWWDVSAKRCGWAGRGGGGTMWVPGWGEIVAVWRCLGHSEHAYSRGNHATPCNSMQLFKQLWTAPCNCLSNCLSAPCNAMQRHATVYATSFLSMQRHATPCNCLSNSGLLHATVYTTAFLPMQRHATPCNAQQRSCPSRLVVLLVEVLFA
jgi:hypothetical protein